jgi:S1-C subfamily serine protease
MLLTHTFFLLLIITRFYRTAVTSTKIRIHRSLGAAFKVVPFVVFVSLSPWFARSAEAQDCRSIRDEFRSSVIFLHVEKIVKETGAGRISNGTGFLVSSGGYVLTNNHVIRKDADIDDVTVTGSLGSNAASPRSMKVIGQDSEDDVAVLQFKDTSQSWKTVPIGDPAREEQGDALCSFGFPLDIEFFMTEGKLGGKGGNNGWWFSSIDSNTGESGAPVFDTATGRVVALKVGERDDAKHITYLIPINLASRVFRDCTGLELLPPRPPVDPEALRKSGWLNLGVSIAVLVAGVIVLRYTRPAIFSTLPYTEIAFYFWLLQWVGFVLIWFVILLQRNDKPDLRSTLAAIDAQSVLALGLFFAFFKGPQFHWKPTTLDLLSVFGLALIWNLGFHELTATRFGHEWDWLWIFASQILSGTALGLVAFAFVWRYRTHGIIFALVTLVYILLQSPIYQGTFVHPPVDPFWANALAGGKFVYASVFYAMFFFQPIVSGPIGTPTFTFYRGVGPSLEKGLVRLVVLITGAIFAESIKYFSPILQGFIGRLLHHFSP